MFLGNCFQQREPLGVVAVHQLPEETREDMLGLAVSPDSICGAVVSLKWSDSSACQGCKGDAMFLRSSTEVI